MSTRRTAQTVRLISHRLSSLGRTRPTRKTGSRRRPTPKYLPAKLRLIRDRAGLSQGEMAKALGVKDRSSVSGYERGEREPPLPTLLAYSNLSGWTINDLVDDKVRLS